MPVLILCGLVLASAILLLFTRQKQKLDQAFMSMITNSLNIHTRSNTRQVDQAIAAAKNTLSMAEDMLRLTDHNTPQAILERVSATHPGLTLFHMTAQALKAGPLPFVAPQDAQVIRRRLEQGETVVAEIYYDQALAVHFLPVIMPLAQNGEVGALYACIDTDELFSHMTESAVYQNVQSCLMTADGRVFFNTFLPKQGSNLFETLPAYGLTDTELARITDIIHSEAVDSTTFIRRGKTYFVSSDRLAHNDWRMVCFVRGPDVLLHSSLIIRDLVCTGAISVALTAMAVSGMFFIFFRGRRRLEQAQQDNVVLAHRPQAMFNQHSALKVVFDAETSMILDVNAAMLSCFGYTKDEVVGQTIQALNLLPGRILDEKFKSGLNRGIFLTSAPHRLKNGETRLFDVYASTIYDGESRLFYAILFDVTDREGYRDALFREKELLRTTLHSIGDGVVITDNAGVITSLNIVAEQMTGWDSGTAVGRLFTEVFTLRNEETGASVESPIQKVLETGQVVGRTNHTDLVSRQGTYISIAESAAPIRDELGQTFGVVMVFRDVSAEKAHNRQIRFLSYHDALTGLFNRRYIEEMMSRIDAEGQAPVSIIMADVNGLKITNDVFGHKVGDTLLKNVADLMKACGKERHVVARWGGDEFVILMPDAPLKEAEAVVKKIKDARIVIENGNLLLSLSLGCACKTGAQGSLETAMQRAEEYMHHQKLLDGKSYRNAIISTLLATLYEKSNETEEHSKRLEKHCHDIGRRLGLSSKELDGISLLALLHDIGKVGIDPNILRKPDALTPAEREEMKHHPEIGYRIAQATPELAVVADLILSHHERWDGTGYPRRLAGAEIPLPCRILAVVDVYDAMTNDRVYRMAKSREAAICELRQNAGTQFDPDIVALFIELLQAESQVCFSASN